MEITPGRAPFTEDEDYTPLRKPKSATNTPTHVGVQQQQHQHQQQQQLAYNMVAGVTGGVVNMSLGYAAPQSPTDAYGRTVSPSKLSPFAKEFVPRFSGSNATQERIEQQQRHQQQYNQQQYQQYHQPRQQQQQQRYSNGGYQPQHQQHHQQQQQYASQSSSVQERLKVSGGGAGGSGGGGGGGGPKNNYYQPRHHHSNKHHNHHNQHNQQRYHQHPSAARNHPNAASTSGGAGGSGAEVETIALDYLQTVIQCLNQNPGQFDTVATRFLTIFDGMENNQYVLSNAMEDIFQESIQNPNFRYMGAKLYNLLHMLNLKKDSLFHTLLKCKLDYHQQEVLQFMTTSQQQKVRETALFLAELYMQLRGDDSRIHLIAENIVYSLKQLLSKESNDNVRCICLTLKLAGYDLTADCPGDMQEIISQLDAINVSAPGKYPLASNVIALQKNNWGRKVSTSSLSMCDHESMKPPEPLRTSDEPIFYGPDGRELTAEESDFLSGDAAAVGGSTDDEDLCDADVDYDPEMDEETEKAYKEFCKLNATT